MNWNSSILWSIIGSVCGVIVCLLFYFLGKIHKILVYNINTTTIISDNTSSIEGLSIKYNQNEISDFYTSIITIKNKGNSVIEPNDLLSPLSFITNGEFFMNSIKLHTENDINNIHVIFSQKESNINQKAIIEFDYLPVNKTISFTIFHTGRISLSGTFKNGTFKRGTIKKAEKENKPSRINMSFILGILFQIIINIISNVISNYLIK